ncbi:DoxX family protein [Ideonella sp. DXS29W]|uniref:DoxX family protein n=1 Tax=Ideonella lacteola TaxID=2984193 RepID=A0ABU9BHG4_9BURK
MLTAPPVLARAWLRAMAGLEALQPLALLAARLYVAKAFFLSGLTKIQDWDTTLALFADEYHVPLLPPEVAAVAGTTGELVLPVLLAFGLAGRFGAMGLFVMNIVAVLSLQDIPEPALQQHIFWGSLLTGVILWGPGRWSVDRFVAPSFLRSATR